MPHMLRAMFAASLTLAACHAQTTCPPTATAVAKPFAMRTYVFVTLRRGPAWSAEQTPESKRLFEGHMANIKAMAAAKKLLIAGPFDTPKEDVHGVAGIFIFDATTAAEVEPLLAHDPAIAAGRLVPEIASWYGPVGLTYDGAGHETTP